MTKSDLIGIMAKAGDVPKAKAESMFHSLISGVSDALKSRERVVISGFGTFSVRQSKAHYHQLVAPLFDSNGYRCLSPKRPWPSGSRRSVAPWSHSSAPSPANLTVVTPNSCSTWQRRVRLCTGRCVTARPSTSFMPGKRLRHCIS